MRHNLAVSKSGHLYAWGYGSKYPTISVTPSTPSSMRKVADKLEHRPRTIGLGFGRGCRSTVIGEE